MPSVITDRVAVDADDPAIWINSKDPAASLVLGTDKGGYVWVFDLEGRTLADRRVSGLGRANNVDVEYGLHLNGASVDIAVVTDVTRAKLRVFRLPEMKPIDAGGIDVFVGENGKRARPMGIGLYKSPSEGTIYAIVSRKNGPSGSYLWQYRLEDDGRGVVTATKVREFGKWSGRKEIESVAVDDELGYVYYSDEVAGVRKYHADPNAANSTEELAFFATSGFREDREGISIYPVDRRSGYILVSDQAADRLLIFRREGEPDDPHRHELVTGVRLAAIDIDGCEVTNAPLNSSFSAGMLVAMSDSRHYHFYSWLELASGSELESASSSPPSARRERRPELP